MAVGESVGGHAGGWGKYEVVGAEDVGDRGCGGGGAGGGVGVRVSE